MDMTSSDASIINGAGDMLGQDVGLVLSHVPQHLLGDGDCDLTVATSISITTPLQVDGNAVPSGCVFTTYSEFSE